ncbi:MAG: cytochrome c [Rhodocyclaceae bacterium]|nr:cytochrome c [Rhodocyclaceae bacterium]
MALTTVVNLALAQIALDAPGPTTSAERQRELTPFVRQECGFCHGLQLTGGLGSPLTAQALDGKSPEALEATILYGRTGTAMPGWTPHLGMPDANWIVSELLKGFPQWIRHRARRHRESGPSREAARENIASNSAAYLLTLAACLVLILLAFRPGTARQR